MKYFNNATILRGIFYDNRKTSSEGAVSGGCTCCLFPQLECLPLQSN